MRDLSNIKDIPLYDLALAYHIELTQKSSNEYCAPCPACGGTDRFVIDTDKNMWFCRKSENGHRDNGDTIEFIMLVEGCDFKSACTKLENGNYGTTYTNLYTSPIQAQHAPTVTSQFDSNYFGKMLEKNLDYMNKHSQQGKYLLSRGISLETAQTFKIGGSYAHGEKAIAIPYYDWDNNLIGGRWRILEPKTNQRYHAWKGSNLKHAFGWHAHKPTSDTLIICEGEINAMSICETEPDINVLSMGSENSHIHPGIVAHIGNYEKVILWGDSDSCIERWTNDMPNYTRSFISPMRDGVKWDANECLKRNKLDIALHKLLTGSIGQSRAVKNFLKHELGQ